MLIGVGDPAVMLFLKGVFRRLGVGIAALAKRLDELFPLLVGRKMQEGMALFGRDDIDHILVQPLFVRGLELLLELIVARLLGFGALLRLGFLVLLVRRALRALRGLLVLFLRGSSVAG